MSMLKLNARQLRITEPDADQIASLSRRPVFIILDNVLDTYNVGSIFRLADAVAAEKIMLCGETLTPPNPRIKKASISTWKWVKWEYSPSGSAAIAKLRQEVPGIRVIGVEQYQKSVPFDRFDYRLPLALVVGNETYGISREVLDLCDGVVELPMFGVNKSLNVMVTTGIVLYSLIAKSY